MMVLSLLHISLLLSSGWLIVWIWIRQRRLTDFKTFPQLPPDILLGHLRHLYKCITSGRPHEDISYAFEKISLRLGRPSVMLFDLRPFNKPLLIINSHEVAEQISKPSKEFKYSVPKSDVIRGLDRVTGKTSIVTADGEDWKAKRKRFNPAFAPDHLMTLLPKIVAMTRKFVRRVDDLAVFQEPFLFDELTTALTFDIIGSVVLETDFQAQEGPGSAHPLLAQFTHTMQLYADQSIVDLFNPISRWKKKRAGKLLDVQTKAIINEKCKEFKQSKGQSSRSVLEISLQHFDVLTTQIIQETADQIRTFLLAGHDTTSITIQWAIYELSRSPRAAQQLTEELDTVFGRGSDVESVFQQMLTRGHEVMNKLHYTSAITKETLRLYPPAATMRRAADDSEFSIVIPETGERVSVGGLDMYVNHWTIGRDRKVFGDDADFFVPDRWLSDRRASMQTERSRTTSHKDIPGSAWRPFERGPRNCIGQELANIEVRVILACIGRHYRFTKVGIGALEVGTDGRHVMDSRGSYQVEGEELYNRRTVTARPVDYMYVKVAKIAR